MVEDVLLAEAVVARALGAVPELHVRIVRVRLAADTALVVVAPLLLLGVDRLPELHRLGPGPGSDHVRLPVELRGEEHKEVQKGYHRDQRGAPRAFGEGEDHRQAVEGALRPGYPFHFDGNHKHDPHHGLWVRHGVGEEQRGVDIIGSSHIVGHAADQGRQQHGNGGEQHAADIINRKLGAAPQPLQRFSQPVVKNEGDKQPDAIIGGDQRIGDDPPQLSGEYRGCVKGQETQGPGLGKHAQKVYDQIGADDIAHETRDAKPGMERAETVYGLVQLSQRGTPPVLYWIGVLYSLREKKSSLIFEHLT